MAYGIAHNVITIFSAGKHPPMHCFQGFYPIITVIFYFILSWSTSEVAWRMPALVIFAIGPYFTLNASRLIIATVTKQKFIVLEDLHLSLPTFVGLSLLILNKQLGMNEIIIFLGMLIGNFFMYFWYIVHVIDQICEALDINCLTIKHKAEKPKAK